MDNWKSSRTSKEPDESDFTNSPKLFNNFPSKELVGCQMNMVIFTHPSIAFAISIASQTSEPTQLF